MKKALIAGAASVALAAMPMAGVFAADITLTDTLNVTVNEVCTMTQSGVATSPATYASNTYAKTMTSGETATLGTTSLLVKCNNPSGYKIKGTFANLAGQKSSENSTTNGDSIEYAATLAAGKWTAYLGSSETGITSAEATNIASTNASGDTETGVTYSITYKVQTTDSQTAGFYTGTATYELTKNS